MTTYATRFCLDRIADAMEAAWNATGRAVTGRDLTIAEFRGTTDLPVAPAALTQVLLEAHNPGKTCTHWRGQMNVLLRIPSRLDAAASNGEDTALAWADAIRDALLELDSDGMQLINCRTEAMESKGAASIGGLPVPGPWQDDGSETTAGIRADILLVDLG